MTTLAHSFNRYLFALLLGATWIIHSEPFWDKLLSLAEQRYGIEGRHTLSQWRTMLEQNKTEKETTQLVNVNDFFNQRIQFADDSTIWSKPDYWATPLETMGTAKGDCEDFSIAKYISLLKLGIADDKLRLTYVKATLSHGAVQAHMVLVYYPKPNSDPLVLDNISTQILPASKRPDLSPVFSFNSAGLWVGSSTEPKVRDPETRLSRWRDVLVRMQHEGLK